MNKKFYFSSVAAVALLSACSSDELAPQQKEEVADILASRPKIEVSFGLDAPATRMFGGVNDKGYYVVKFDTKDVLGAVLVDQGKSTPANYYDLVASNTHIGNNRFAYNTVTGKFETPSTMCVGSWLFYTPYKEENTTSRGSIKFNIPIVQTYAQDFTKLAVKDFRFSPIVNLTGSEDGYFEYNIPTVSAYTYANIVLKFPKAVTVQKLVLKPSGQADGTTYDPFAATYELNMGTATGTTAGLAAAVAELNKPFAPGETIEGRLEESKNALLAKAPYLKATVASGSDTEQLIALNCLDSELQPSTDFKSFMLIPSGEYTCIRLYAYTDDGIYVYNINDECEAVAGTRPNSLCAGETGITLKREVVTLHNIAGYTTEGNGANADYAALTTKYIKMETKKTNPQLQATTETEGTVVISQKDLLAVINGISDAGNMNVRVLGDMVKITKEVADAIVAAEKRVNGDIQLIFDKEVEIEGTAEGYTLTDVTFAGDAKLTTGTVNLGVDINIPSGKKLTVNSGATLNANTVAGTGTTSSYIYDKIVNNGTLNADVAALEIGTVENNATLTVKKNAEISTLTNAGTTTVNTGVTLTTAFTNSRVGGGATILNNGTIKVDGTSSNSNNLTNNGEIHVQSVTLTNTGTINNKVNAKIISGVAGGNAACIKNEGTIENYGFLYCYNSDTSSTSNTIENTAIIYAKENSTTYITKNSSAVENTNGTKDENMKMGVINLDNRNEDISVTTPANKGYIVWTTSETNIAHKTGDKYNKVILTADATIQDQAVRYIETSAQKLTINISKVQELTFKDDATLSTNGTTVGYLEIASGKVVKVPTENKIGIEDVYSSDNNSKTAAQINNNGTLLVGGDLYSSAITACPAKGIFAAGDGGTTAFHWGDRM